LEIEVNSSEFDSVRNTAQSLVALQSLVSAVQVVTDAALARISAISSTPVSGIPAPYPFTGADETSVIFASYMGIKRLISVLGAEVFTSSAVIKVSNVASAVIGGNVVEDEEALEKARAVMKLKLLKLTKSARKRQRRLLPKPMVRRARRMPPTRIHA
jgi:hypothetical protein